MINLLKKSMFLGLSFFLYFSINISSYYFSQDLLKEINFLLLKNLFYPSNISSYLIFLYKNINEITIFLLFLLSFGFLFIRTKTKNIAAIIGIIIWLSMSIFIAHFCLLLNRFNFISIICLTCVSIIYFYKYFKIVFFNNIETSQ